MPVFQPGMYASADLQYPAVEYEDPFAVRERIDFKNVGHSRSVTVTRDEPESVRCLLEPYWGATAVLPRAIPASALVLGLRNGASYRLRRHRYWSARISDVGVPRAVSGSGCPRPMRRVPVRDDATP